MDFGQIKTAVFDWVDLPEGTGFSDDNYARLKGLANQAYQFLVEELDRSPLPRNVAPVTDTDFWITVETSTTQREYLVAPGGRGIVEVHVPETSTSARPTTVIREVTFNERNTSAVPGYYAFTAPDGSWYIGSVIMPPPWTQLRVGLRPDLVPLQSDSDVPTQVADNMHELIVYTTAVFALSQEGREIDQLLATLYASGLDRIRGGAALRQDLGARKL